MEIAIIEAGNVGAALATAWSRAGHSFLLAQRDAGKHGELIEKTGALALTHAEGRRERRLSSSLSPMRLWSR